MRKRVFVIGVAIVAVALAFVLTDSLLITLGAGVTEANARRIRMGMPKSQIERILGGSGQPSDWLPAGECEARLWTGEEGQVQVRFDCNGCVEAASFFDRLGGVSV